MKLEGFINDLAHLRDFQWQGKIHTKITFDSEGNVLFGTDGGESREEYLMNHPQGYAGGYLMKWDPEERQLTNLGMPMQYESIKNIDVDPETGIIYAITRRIPSDSRLGAGFILGTVITARTQYG